MKITHILPALTKGGAEKVVVDLANVCSKKGHELTVLVACSVNPELLRNKLASSVQVRSIGNEGRSALLRYLAMIPWIIKNWQWIKEQDVLHFHLTFGAVFGSIVWFIRGFTREHKPLIIETNHSVGMPIKHWQNMAFRIMARMRDGYVLVAENSEWKSFLQKPGMPLSEFIPNGIEIPNKTVLFEDNDECYLHTWKSKEKIVMVGTIGRIIDERKPLEIINVFSEIHKALAGVRKVHFILGGDGPEKESVIQHAKHLQIGEIVYLPGLISDSIEVMKTMDLYISINVGEITGIAGMEAAAIGIPVIALQMSEDYTPSDHDWIWSINEPKVLAAKAIELLLDNSKRLALGQQQRKHVINNFSDERMETDYSKFYLRVLNYK